MGVSAGRLIQGEFIVMFYFFRGAYLRGSLSAGGGPITDFYGIAFHCPYVPRLGIITAENRQKYPAILCLVSCRLTPKFSNPVFDLVEDRLVIHKI